MRTHQLLAPVTALALLGGAVVAPQASAATEVPGIASGRLDWNLKRSFSNYVTGPIAKGKVTVNAPADTTNFKGFLEHKPPSQNFQRDEAPLKYGFKLDPQRSNLDANGKGVLAFDGSVRWTGHKAFAPEGQDHGLDVQFSDVKVHVDGTAGKISLDYVVRGTNITGDQSALNERGDDAVFATFTLPEPIKPTAGGSFTTSPGGVTRDSGIKTTLTEEGAKKVMIGFYKAEEYTDALLDLKIDFKELQKPAPSAPAAPSSTKSAPSSSAQPSSSKPAPSESSTPATTSAQPTQPNTPEGSSGNNDIGNTKIIVPVIITLVSLLAFGGALAFVGQQWLPQIMQGMKH
ncbi:HtaA domain-containing protein [Corynebacterium sp. TA-R-1]|uniref:HtaA domain-containing protein n=1 Tax=Corynebacterium stercoris TaxID=2943490 RepID=A0ABT1G124_9CORY|nr:HtaA domain-containing protein [Corynebacterium stercoris]MCP1387690.1 HtaA domain-containing protein [Corynebacterium stercoris]